MEREREKEGLRKMKGIKKGERERERERENQMWEEEIELNEGVKVSRQERRKNK